MNKLKTDVVFIEKKGRTYSKRTDYFENGNIAHIGMYGNTPSNWAWTIPTGIIRTFYENGRIQSEISYDDHGSLNGESNFYNFYGQKIMRRVYDDDKLIDETVYEVEVV